MAPALEDKDVGVDVLHLEPAADGQRGVCPDPVHQGPQLQQERYCQEPMDHDPRRVSQIPQQNITKTKKSLMVTDELLR